MKYRMEFFPEVSYEPDTDKWRLFPESKLNQDWYDKFVERPPLNQVRKSIAIDGDNLYSVAFESNSTKDAFGIGHDLIIAFIEEEKETMVKRTITCDRCGGNIGLNDNYVVLDGYWTKQEGHLDEMQFHPACWDETLREMKKGPK